MAGSRRKHKKSRAKVRCGLPKKKPGVFKPAFSIPKELLGGDGEEQKKEWDEEGSVFQNYRRFGVVPNPNFLGVRSRTPQVLLCAPLQVPDPAARGGGAPISEFDPIDGGSDLETDDLRSALGKKRKDGKNAPLKPLTKIQRVHISRLIATHGEDYQAMFSDMELNAMQHTLAELKKLCQRFNVPSSTRVILGY
ncbi:nucleolar-like protein [Wolffia australiana]